MTFDSSNFPELPISWVNSSVEDSSEIVSFVIKVPTSKYKSTGKLAIIDQSINFIGGYIDDPDLLVTNDLPVIVFGDHTRVIKYIDFPFAAGADGIKVLKPKEYFNPKLFYYFLQSINLPNKGYARHFQYLRSSIIPIPPYNEQKRIADKLNKLLVRVDACREHLVRVSEILKRFRQAVLSAAISGKLVDFKYATSENWQEVDIQTIAEVGTGSTPLRSNPQFYSTSGIPWITSAATREAFIDRAQEFVTEEGVSAHRLRLYPVGTLIVAMYGEGKTRGQVSELAIKATINQACAAIIVNEAKAEKAYVKIALQANYLEMREMAEGGNQPNLNLSKIKEFRFMLPPREEQLEIIRQVEKLFAFAEKIEAHLQSTSQIANNLTPSILAKAFRGELVPQNPNDEPASILLERIRLERTKQTELPKQIIKKQTPKEVKMTGDSVKEIIRKLPQDTFTFDDLREQLIIDYDEIKELLFNLLAESNPIIKQIFDEKTSSICFTRHIP